MFAKQPVLTTGDFELNYRGTISNETPRYFVEIPQATKDLASSLEHELDQSTIIDDNRVWTIDDLEGETLLRMFHESNDAPVNARIMIAGEEIGIYPTINTLSFPARGNNDENGELVFEAWASSMTGHLNTVTLDRHFLRLAHESYGNESPSVLLREIYGNAAVTSTPSVDWIDYTQWASSPINSNSSYTDTGIATYVYTEGMELVFPENGYPDTGSAVIEMEVIVL